MTEMTGLEPGGEDYGPGSAEADAAHALFAQTVASTRPHLGFTADDMVLGGRRALRRRRVAAVLGGTASVAAVALAATALPGSGGSRAGAASSLASAVGSPTVHSSRGTADGKPMPDDARTTAAKRLAAAVFGDVMGRLDPAGRHLVPPNLPGGQAKYWPEGGLCRDNGLTTSYDSYAFWTADGKSHFPPSAKGAPTTIPYIQVSVAIYAAGADDQFDGGHWGPVSQSALPDGSMLRTATASGGYLMQADRIMSNHEQVVVTLMDGSTIPGDAAVRAMAPATDPFPFTVAQVAASVKDLALPLPFADGFRPHSAC